MVNVSCFYQLNLAALTMRMETAPKTPDDVLDIAEEADEDEVSISYDITSYPSDPTLSVMLEMWNNGDIIVPEYQRNYVWSPKQASLLIESFLLGLPVPQVFFYVDELNKYQVIDGQQRITSIVYYLSGYFGSESIQGTKQVFRLQGLDSKSPYAGKKFDELTETQQRKLKSAVLRAINIRQLNPKGEATSVYHIFERLNTGGTPLKPQEIRNCVFRGNFVKILRELNQDENWRKILGKKTYDKHQKDVELVLRIFALTNYFSEYEKPMKEFLSRVMNKEKTGSSAAVTQFQKKFVKTAAAIVSQMGERPFHVRGPLNASILDTIFSVVLESIDNLPENLGQKYRHLLEDADFANTTFYSTSDLAVVKKRFEKTREYLRK